MTSPTSVLVRGLKAAETTLALVAAQILVFVVPFRLTARLFRPATPVTSSRPSAGRSGGIVIGRRVKRVAGHLPWTSTCLVHALAGALLLSRRGVASHIRFGVHKDGEELAAHAWLMVGDATVLGAGPEADGYVPLADMASS